MALTITAPNELCAVGNPIAWEAVTDGSPAFIVANIQVESAFGTGIFQDLLTKSIPPDESGKAVFRLENNLKAVLQADLPDLFGSSFVKSANACKKYQIRFGELAEGQRIEEVSYGAIQTKYAMLGKLAHHLFPVIDFGGFITRDHLFHDRIWEGQRAYINLMATTAGTFSLTITPWIELVSQPQIVINIGSLGKYQVAHIPIDSSAYPAGTTRVNISGFGPTLDLDISSLKYNPDPREVVYLNSENGWTSLAFLGESEKKTEIETESFRRQLPHDYVQTDTSEIIFSKKRTDGGILRTDYLDLHEYESALLLIDSEHIFLREGSYWFPIKLTTKSLLVNKTRQYLKGLEIEYKHLNEW